MPDQLSRFYKVHTLVDITKTNAIHGGNTPERNQHRNWETLIQVLSLRTQLYNIIEPTKQIMDLDELQFGENFSGLHNIWTMRFTVEFESVFGTPADPFKVLTQDFEMVPIIAGLEESVTITPPIFCTTGPNKNIYFTLE